MQSNLAKLRASIFLTRWPERACCCLQCGSQASSPAIFTEKKSPSLLAFHSSLSVLQLASSYPPAVSPWANLYPYITVQVLGINCCVTALGDILVMLWLPDAPRPARGHPGAAPPSPAGAGLCPSSGQDHKTQALALPTAPHRHVLPARWPILGQHVA